MWSVRRATRRKYSPEEKIRIVLEGFRREATVSNLCRREGINPANYYSWTKEFMEAGKERLTRNTVRDATRQEIEQLKRENGDLKVAHCGDVACTSASTTTIDSAGVVGSYTSITIGADGLPVISYFDITNSSLKVAHCDDVACTSASTTTVDSAGVVGRHTSITIGADGLPVVSYRDGSNGDLKVAHCNDTACTSASTTTVDSAGNVGWYTSITIGADGLPVISYHDNTNTELKVAHCANTFCVPYFRRR